MKVFNVQIFLKNMCGINMQYSVDFFYKEWKYAIYPEMRIKSITTE